MVLSASVEVRRTNLNYLLMQPYSIDGSRYQLCTARYTVGNAFHALRDEQEAKRAFKAALEDPALGRLPEANGGKTGFGVEDRTHPTVSSGV